MTIRPRAARALRDLRTRQRDAAAASHATALAAREATREELDDEYAALAAYLAGARDIHQLDRVAEIRTEHLLAIADATGRHEVTTDEAARTNAHLRQRAR